MSIRKYEIRLEVTIDEDALPLVVKQNPNHHGRFAEAVIQNWAGTVRTLPDLMRDSFKKTSWEELTGIVTHLKVLEVKDEE